MSEPLPKGMRNTYQVRFYRRARGMVPALVDEILARRAEAEEKHALLEGLKREREQVEVALGHYVAPGELPSCLEEALRAAAQKSKKSS